MCNSKNAITPVNKAQGQKNNADTNSVNIYETVQTHGGILIFLLAIITIILVFHCAVKVYKINKNAIKRNEGTKRLNRAMSRMAVQEDN